jgi:DNA repair protein RecN (Recombination protein N)
MEIALERGLSILSGETGAGKSILVGAVNLVLGSRASQEMIRTGANEATVQAVFTPSDKASLGERLVQMGLEPAETLEIRRSITRSGRNRIFANDQSLSLQQLQSLVRGLISISGQHEHQQLLDTTVHLALLDHFGDLDGLCAEVGTIYAQWDRVHDRLVRFQKTKQERSEKREYLRFLLQELESARLQPGEDKTLEQEKHLLRHSATLHETAQKALASLYSGRGSILDLLAGVEKDLDALVRIDPSVKALADHTEQAHIHLRELTHSLQQYGSRLTFDPHRLTEIEDRLALIQKLARKHGGSLEALLERMQSFKEELAEGEDADLIESELTLELEKARSLYLGKATDLSAKRRVAAQSLSREVEAALADLDMIHARFAVSFGSEGDSRGQEPRFSPSGLDQVEFLLSANPGEDLKPLARVASGGELSRILLALKSLLSTNGESETLVFDEVDTGIGGRTAELVGLQLRRLAQTQQVICITHLPQIACYAAHHYKVYKETTHGETATNIRLLPSEERIEEISRMLGGLSISETTRAHAEELLQRGQTAGNR